MKRLYACMKLKRWEHIEIMELPLKKPEGGWDFFIPVFEDRKEAEDFCGDGKVIEIATVSEH